MWEKEVIDTIIPNGEKIIGLLESNQDILLDSEKVIVETYKQHINGLRQNHLGTKRFIMDAPRFPVEILHLQDNAVTYALQNAKSNRNVKDVEVLIRDYTYGLLQVERTGRLSTLKVYIADIYILTAEKVLAIISEHPDINCIVVTSIYGKGASSRTKHWRIHTKGI